MGIEYKIYISQMNHREAEFCLRTLPVSVAYDPTYDLYNLQRTDEFKTATRPDACVAIEKDGIYFCDNLSDDSHHLLEALMGLLKQHFDVVTIVEL